MIANYEYFVEYTDHDGMVRSAAFEELTAATGFYECIKLFGRAKSAWCFSKFGSGLKNRICSF